MLAYDIENLAELVILRVTHLLTCFFQNKTTDLLFLSIFEGTSLTMENGLQMQALEHDIAGNVEILFGEQMHIGTIEMRGMPDTIMLE